MSTEEILELARSADQSEWCSDYCYSAIRHVQRNCDIECGKHGDEAGESCGGFGRYDGPYIAAACPYNMIPLLKELIELRSVVTKIVSDDAFAELCQGIGEEPEWLVQARGAIAMANPVAPPQE